jgi:hypothetical protein
MTPLRKRMVEDMQAAWIVGKYAEGLCAYGAAACRLSSTAP